MDTPTLSRSGFACVYPDGFFVALDNFSGGYPVKATTVGEVKVWSQAEDAQKYAAMFAKDGMRAVTVSVSAKATAFI
jgi:hypothetical protein